MTQVHRTLCLSDGSGVISSRYRTSCKLMFFLWFHRKMRSQKKDWHNMQLRKQKVSCFFFYRRPKVVVVVVVVVVTGYCLDISHGWGTTPSQVELFISFRFSDYKYTFREALFKAKGVWATQQNDLAWSQISISKSVVGKPVTTDSISY